MSKPKITLGLDPMAARQSMHKAAETTEKIEKDLSEKELNALMAGADKAPKPKRKTKGVTISMVFDPELLMIIDEKAKAEYTSRSAIIRAAIAKYLNEGN